MSKLKITLVCEGCGKSFERLKTKYNEALKRGTRILCSRQCFYSNRKPFQSKPKVKVACETCKTEFSKFESQIKLTKHHFCSEKCSVAWKSGKENIERVKTNCGYCLTAMFLQPGQFRWKTANHAHKKIFCTKLCWHKFLSDELKFNNKTKHAFASFNYYRRKPMRSNFERVVESMIKTEFPNLEVNYNALINLHSFDLYIPSLNLAIEINGMCHYFPIYGRENFEYRQKRDKEKVELCKEKSINFEIVKIIGDTRRPINKNKYWNIVKLILEKYLKNVTQTM